jgi:hypothetical protein
VLLNPVLCRSIANTHWLPPNLILVYKSKVFFAG